MSSPPRRTRDASDQELLALVRSRSAGDPGRDAACEEMFRRYGGIARAAAARYRGSPEPTEDLVQAGYVGLMNAITRFDPAVGTRFAAYAAPTVSADIKRHFRDRRWQVKLDRRTQELRLRIRAVTGDLTQQLGHEPSPGELATCLGVGEQQVSDALLAGQALRAASLDAPAVAGDGGTLADLIGADDPALDRAVDLAALWHHCGQLPAREQRLLRLRFWGNLTQDQIASQLGISQVHVSRLLSSALARLRDQLTGQAESAA